MSTVTESVAGDEDAPVEVILSTQPFCFLCRGSYEPGDMGEDEDAWQDLRPLYHSVAVRESLLFLGAMETQRNRRMSAKLREKGVKFWTFHCPPCQGKLESLQKSLDSPQEFQGILELLKMEGEEDVEQRSVSTPFQRKLVTALREELKRKIEVKIKHLRALSLDSEPVLVDSEEVAEARSESESSDSSPVRTSPKKRKNPRRNLKPHLRRTPEPCPDCGHPVKPDRHSQLSHSVSAHPETLFSSLKPPSMTFAKFHVKVKSCFAKEMTGKKGKLRCRRCRVTTHNYHHMMAHLYTAHRADLETRLQKVVKRPLAKTLKQCQYCEKYVNNARQLKIHQTSHHSNAIFARVKPVHMTCPEFKKFCAHAINHRLPEICARRADKRNGVEKRVCSLCDKLFGSGSSLVRHVVSGHTDYLPEFLEEQLKESRE